MQTLTGKQPKTPTPPGPKERPLLCRGKKIEKENKEAENGAENKEAENKEAENMEAENKEAENRPC